MTQSETTSAAGGGERYTVLKADHRRRIQAIGAAISRRDWSAVEQAHAEIRDAFDRPDIYDPAAPTAKGGTEGMRAALAPFADAWRACMELGDQGAGYVQDNQDAWVSGNKSGGAHPLFKFGDLRRAAEALASPPPLAGAAGGGSVDLGALSAEAVAAAYYNCMIGDPKEFWPHHDGWAGKSEAFKAKVRDRMAKALKIAALSAPTPDLGAQGEPVAWALELADSFERSGKTLFFPEQHSAEYVEGWKVAHALCARDLRHEAKQVAPPSLSPVPGDAGDLAGQGEPKSNLAFALKVLADAEPWRLTSTGHYVEVARACAGASRAKGDAAEADWYALFADRMEVLRMAADALLARLTPVAPSPATDLASQGETEAARDVLAERRRQVEAEGYTSEHDDGQFAGSLAVAAACYARHAARSDDLRGLCRYGEAPTIWPFAPQYFRPTTRRRDLIKAGALILAEIERLDRLDILASGAVR